MPVAAGVVRDLRMAARCVLAARDMAAECRRATALDRTHHLQLLKAHMGAIGLTPGKAVIAEDIRDLQSWSSHGRWRYGAGGSSLSRFARRRRGALRSSSGLSILAIIPIATRLSLPRSSRWVAKLWRSECSGTVLRSPAALAASLNSRLN